MRILVTGKDGQLGRSIQNLVTSDKQNDDFVFAGRKELDLSSESNIDHYFEGSGRFDIIVNCAAYTAVDKAEEEWSLANQVNHLAVKKIAKIAVKQKAKLIHISTDYVFDGESNESYVETDKPNPINVYGKTKLAGELAVQEAMITNAIIIRASWIYSEYGNNFVKTILKAGQRSGQLNIVSDQVGSPTYAADLAVAILKIIEDAGIKSMNPTKVYHYSNGDKISWYEFAREIFALSGVECQTRPITTEQYSPSAARPKNTAMKRSTAFDLLGAVPRSRDASLKECVLRIESKA